MCDQLYLVDIDMNEAVLYANQSGDGFVLHTIGPLYQMKISSHKHPEGVAESIYM